MAQHFVNLSRDEIETIALRALAYLMSEPSLAHRFLSETGFDPALLRVAPGAPEVLDGALSVLANDEAALLAFAANAGLDPLAVMTAHRALASDRDGRKPQVST
ncbi:MAG: DUF3572 domain-containing protein [Alphaproteobacteria bacterium]|nr:DUF3572 domain-containing protein [Alphaproteobacteria bacterium]